MRARLRKKLAKKELAAFIAAGGVVVSEAWIVQEVLGLLMSHPQLDAPAVFGHPFD